MAHTLGKSFRKGVSLTDLFDMFPDDETAEQWFVQSRWPDGLRCARCDGDNVANQSNHPNMPYHCRDCRRFFSVKLNSIMQGSPIGYRKWAIAIYLLATNLKGVSAMKLRRDLDVTYKTAWFMAHRIRETWEDGTGVFDGSVEVDEAYIGGKERNKHEWKKQNAGRGAVGKAPVVAMKERESGQVKAEVVEITDGATLRKFVRSNTDEAATVYTDEAAAYNGMGRKHEAVKHSVKEFVRGRVHTNGIESFWAMLKRGYYGTYHHMSGKHLQRYVNEFAGRHNQRPLDTRDQMSAMVRRMDGKRLRYEDLIGPPATRQPAML